MIVKEVQQHTRTVHCTALSGSELKWVEHNKKKTRTNIKYSPSNGTTINLKKKNNIPTSQFPLWGRKTAQLSTAILNHICICWRTYTTFQHSSTKEKRFNWERWSEYLTISYTSTGCGWYLWRRAVFGTSQFQMLLDHRSFYFEAQAFFVSMPRFYNMTEPAHTDKIIFDSMRGTASQSPKKGSVAFELMLFPWIFQKLQQLLRTTLKKKVWELRGTWSSAWRLATAPIVGSLETYSITNEVNLIENCVSFVVSKWFT